MNSVDTYRSARRASRRRNCLTETTRTLCLRAILIKSRSRLRSSSLVTRCVALPTIAASKMSSSSGSRQAFSSPEVSTTVTRAAISLTKLSASRCGYLNFRKSRGRLRTSVVSASCDNDVTVLNLSRLQALTIFPGGPAGLRNAETQTLVSSRATRGTTFCLDLGPGLGDLHLDVALRNCFGMGSHPAQQSIEVSAPSRFGAQGNRDTRLFFQCKGAQGSKYTVFIYCFYHPLRGNLCFRQRHEFDNSDCPPVSVNRDGDQM